MFPLSLDCLLCFVCLTSVSCVPDVLDNLETLETSGKQDTEVRQRKHNRQSRDTGNIRTQCLYIVCCALFVLLLCLVFLMFAVSLECPMFCLETVETSGTQDKTLDNLETLQTSGTQDTEGRVVCCASFVLLLCLVFLMFPVSLDCLLCFVYLT
jgi:hypothetical protein